MHLKIRQHIEPKDIDWELQYPLIQELKAIIDRDSKYAGVKQLCTR